MAVLWGDGGCRLDLEAATFDQIARAVRCQFPYATPAQQTAIAVDLYEQKLAVQLAGKSAAEIARLTNTLLVTADENARAILEGTLSQSSASSRQITDKALKGITDTTDYAGDVLDALGSAALGAVNTQLAGAAAAVQAVTGGAVGKINELVGGAGLTLESISGTVTRHIGELVGQGGTVLESIGGTLTRHIGDLVGSGIDVLESAGLKIDELLEDIGGGIRPLADELLARITGLAPDLVALAGNIATSFTDPLAGGIAGLIGGLTDPRNGILGSFFEADEPELLDALRPALQRAARAPGMPPEIGRLFTYAAGGTAPLQAIIGTLVLSAALSPALNSVVQPFVELGAREARALARSSTLSLSDAVTAEYRKITPPGYANRVGAWAGFTDADVDVARDVLRPLPTPGDLLDWRHRELVTDQAARVALAAHGFAPADVDTLIEASELIPPLSDLVRFAVREAFAGQVGFGGARGANVPGRFAEVAAKLGLSDEFIQSYWAAHWELPAPGQGFEMLHRGIIDEPALRQLLVELDLAPEWVERMIALSYNPLTRVDVRRMYDLGVMDAAGVERAYLNLGYSPTDAALLREFVVRLGKDVEDLAETPERDLTRGDLLGMYADGLLTPAAVRDQLVAIGYSGSEADLLVSREDLRAVLANRKRLKEQIVDQAVAGVIDYATAEDRLNAAGLEAGEVALTLKRITDEQGAQSARPSRAELSAFYKQGVIDVDTYKAELRALGYAERWVDAYAATVKKAPAAAV